MSTMDLHPPPLISNGPLAAMLDHIFLTSFLKTPRVTSSGLRRRLPDLYEDLQQFNITVPEVPMTVTALRNWMAAASNASRLDRQRGAQLEAPLVLAALELRMPQALPGEDDPAATFPGPEGDAVFSMSGALPLAPTLMNTTGFDFPTTDGSSKAKPFVTYLRTELYEVLLKILGHKLTFPGGLRDRLYNVMVEEYHLTKEQRNQLQEHVLRNLDGYLLTETELLRIEKREHTRLAEFRATYHLETKHLVQPSTVPPPAEKGKPPRFTRDIEVKPRRTYEGAFYCGEHTKSLPDIHSFATSTGGREMFKVSQVNGPLTMDHDLKKLRTTGLFMRMPPLGF